MKYLGLLTMGGEEFRAIAFEDACVGIWKETACEIRKWSKNKPHADRNVAGAKARLLAVGLLRHD